jgi:hypothetical protein
MFLHTKDSIASQKENVAYLASYCSGSAFGLSDYSLALGKSETGTLLKH